MTALLAWYEYPYTALFHVPAPQGYFLLIALVVARLVFAGLVVARTGHTAVWMMLLLIPYSEVLAPWLLAYLPWPAEAAAKPSSNPAS